MDRAVLEAPGHDAAAGAVLHDEVERDVFDEELDFVLEALLIQRVQDRVPGAVGGGAGAHGGGLAVIHHVTAEWALIDAAVLGAAERDAVMLELVDGGDRLTAHVFDRVLVAEPVRPLDGVVHVPAPIVLAHVAERGADTALGSNRVAAGREYLGEAGSPQSGRPHAERCPQPGPACAHDHHVIGVIGDRIGPGRGRADGVHDGSPRVNALEPIRRERASELRWRRSGQA